jgi:AraC family transcriptional regulator
LPEIVLFQDQLGGSRVSANSGGGHFNVMSEQGAFFLAAPNFAHTVTVDTNHQLRGLSFSLTQWQHVLDEASEGNSQMNVYDLPGVFFTRQPSDLALQKLWFLCEEEGLPSRLLVRAAGCEILAELCRLSGSPLPTVNGGLAPLAKRRSIEAMRTRMAEDLSLDQLAAEVRPVGVSFRANVQTKPRGATQGLSNAIENGKGNRASPIDRALDYRDCSRGWLFLQPSASADIPQALSQEPDRLSPCRSQHGYLKHPRTGFQCYCLIA